MQQLKIQKIRLGMEFNGKAHAWCAWVLGLISSTTKINSKGSLEEEEENSQKIEMTDD